MSVANLSNRGRQLLNAVRLNFELLKEHDKVAPTEVNTILAASIEHIRAFRPQLLAAVTAPEVDHGG